MKIVVAGALGHIGSVATREILFVYPETEIVMVDNLATQCCCSLFNLPLHCNMRHFARNGISYCSK